MNGACLVVLVAGLILAGASCVELTHMGQISDREASWPINDVRIEQQQGDGSWKQLCRTDGKGRWWVLKDRIGGGGRIRLSKPGYADVVMSEAEFLQTTNLLMIPSEEPGDGGGFGEDGLPARRRR